MNKKIIFIVIGSVVVVITAISIYFASQEIQKSHDEGFEWLTSGPFSVQNYQHRLGENIFIVAYGIPPNEKGTIQVFTPKNIEYISYPFDGSVKSSFNVYFKPSTLAKKDRCNPEDLVGVWTMKFVGVDYPPLQFEFINEYVRGAEAELINLCRNAT